VGVRSQSRKRGCIVKAKYFPEGCIEFICYNTNLLYLLRYRSIQTLRLRTRIKPITIMMIEAQTLHMIFSTLEEADVAKIEML
jgi:hypothetical protein